MIHIEFDPGLDAIVPQGNIERAARAVLSLSGAVDAELSVVLTSDERIQALNREYRGIDTPTDVLSFTADEPDPETGQCYLGDVIISTQRAAKQAKTGRHPLVEEIQLLVIHGVLHLLGHDHASPDEKSRMWAAQADALKTIGVSPAIIHE